MNPVKRAFATLMLVLFLLNVLGYYGIYHGLMAKSSTDLASQVSGNVDAIGATMTIKVPLTVPYGVDSREYEAVSGQFEFEGEIYQMVKQKLVRDTLYVVGVKDERSSMWSKALAEYVMSFSDTRGDDSQDVTASPGFIKDFISITISVTGQTCGWVLPVAPASEVTPLVSSFCASVVHPPERA